MNDPISANPYNDLTSAFVREFVDAQNEIKVDAKFLARALKRLINAKKIDTFKGTVESFDSDGNLVRNEVVIYSKPMHDNATCRQALQMALNSRGVQTSSPTHQTMIGQASEINIMGAVAQIMSERGDEVDD